MPLMRWCVAWLSALTLVATNAFAQTPPPQPAQPAQPQYPPAYPYPPPYPYQPYPYPYPPPYPYPSPQAQPQPTAPPRAAEPPHVIKYREGDPIPAGYRLVERTRHGLVIAGWVLTATAYGIGVMAATSASFENESGWLLLPFAGPWMTLGRREYCDPPPEDPNDENANASAECLADVFVVMGLVFDGIMQTAGGTLLLIGYMVPKRELVRQYSRVHVGPMRVGSGYGIGLTLF